MLNSLSIRNVVLIDSLDLDLVNGLNVFTGETGAGKSILLDSLSLALGARADSGLVRHGCREAIVTASFSVGLSHPVGMVLSAHGFEFDGEIILRRVVSSDGRSKAFVNDQPVSISFLKSVGDSLIEIHGQFASHRLLNPATHLETLDNYCGAEDVQTDCRRSFHHWQYKKKQRDDAERMLMCAKKEEEFLRSAIDDLEQLHPEVDEEETLIQRRTMLMNSEKIMSALNVSYAVLGDEATGAERQIGQALTQLERANQWSEGSLSGILDTVGQVASLLADSLSELEREMEKWGDISELPQIDDRLFALRDRSRKHQVSISELPNLLIDLKKKLACVEQGEDTIVSLRKEEEKARLDYIACAQKLSAKRLAAAKDLDKAVKTELPALKLGKAVFKTELFDLPEDEWNENGMNRASFWVSTNAGTPPAPIHKVASGGELARFMLALKVNLAKTDQMGILVFDEVDSGVGGATAAAVGDRLRQLAKMCQVLVVTHSPQVAAFGQSHYTVSKKETENNIVVTQVEALTFDERLDELARMLSGEKMTQTARVMAQELLETCSKISDN